MLDAEKWEGPSASTGVAKLWEQPYACHARLQILRCLYKYSKDTYTAKSWIQIQQTLVQIKVCANTTKTTKMWVHWHLTGLCKLWEQPCICHACLKIQISKYRYKYSKNTNKNK